MTEDPLGRLLLLLILLLLGGFIAAVEAAVSTLNSSRLKKPAEDGEDKAVALMKIADEPEQLLSALGLWFHVVLVLSVVFAVTSFGGRMGLWLGGLWGALSEPAAENLGQFAVAVVALYLWLSLGSILPRKLAFRYPEQLLSPLTGLLRFLAVVIHPAVWLIDATADGLLKLFRIDPAAQGEAVSEEEIRLMVDIGGETGSIEPEERDLIENIFEFNNMTAEDVMIHRKDMVMLYADDNHREIMSQIKASGLSRFPVCGEDVDDIVGILRTREYLLNLEEAQPKPLSQLLAPVYFVPESVPADVLFRDMQKKKIHLAIVVDEYGGTSGLVTLEDLLEEIVGNIYDEFDPQEKKGLIKLEDNLWRVSGSMELEDLQSALQWDFPCLDDEYETLGGLIFSCLSEIPADGSQPVIEVAGLIIRVEQLKDRRVEWALVSLADAPLQVFADDHSV